MDVDHEDGIRSGRWMHSAREQHERKRQGQRDDIRRQGVAQELIASDTDECATEMAAKQGSRLGCRCTSEAEQEDCCSAKGCQEEGRLTRADERESQTDAN